MLLLLRLQHRVAIPRLPVVLGCPRNTAGKRGLAAAVLTRAERLDTGADGRRGQRHGQLLERSRAEFLQRVIICHQGAEYIATSQHTGNEPQQS